MPQIVKRRLIFLLQFWPVIASVLGGVLYEVREIAALKSEVSILSNSVNRIDNKLDDVLLSNPNFQKTKGGNEYVWTNTDERSSNDDTSARH